MPQSGPPGSRIDPERVVITEEVRGSDFPVHLMYVETIDGLYTPIGLRKPHGEGPFPIVLLASGNGSEGMRWVRDAVQNRGYIMERLLKAGYACAWLRYRAEVELGYNNGGKLIRGVRTRRLLLNRSPLEYEDEISVIEYVKALPFVDPGRVGLLGMSHGGEMILKITSEYDGVVCAVASEPASHEFLVLHPEGSNAFDPATKMRKMDEQQMPEVAKVLARADRKTAMERIRTIGTPILVMGRETDHLQGVFRATYELLKEAGKDVEWVSYDHPDHGYVYPFRAPSGRYEPDPVQLDAIAKVIAYFDRHLKK
ncbi:MAG: prolyl oligopeptidase family serine peptidase [Candidatus Tectomicrobia bacterium]|nr:prolyl oligopeptidase family serine peptidase [Candidatus Tectomicrobia bacterium]